MTLDEDRPAPDWLGDVSAGVDAWTWPDDPVALLAPQPPNTVVEVRRRPGA